MKTKDVRAWWAREVDPYTVDDGIAGARLVSIPYDLREKIVDKIMRAYASGIFRGSARARKQIRDAEGRTSVQFPQASESHVVIPANAVRDGIRKSLRDMREDEQDFEDETQD